MRQSELERKQKVGEAAICNQECRSARSDEQLVVVDCLSFIKAMGRPTEEAIEELKNARTTSVAFRALRTPELCAERHHLGS